MTLVRSAFEAAYAPPFVIGPSAGSQPITLGMRVGHRLAGCLPVAPRVLANTAPLVSFSFDDVPDSAVTTGADLMEEFGAHGTFFVATGLLGQIGENWRLAGAGAVASLAARGHEVALHTHAHRPAAALAPRDFAADLAECGARLRTLTGGRARANFAFPYGFSHWAHRRVLASGLRSSRTAHPGLNEGRTDLHFLRSWVFGSTLNDPAAVDRLLDDAVARRGWLIFTGHDVSARPSAYGCVPGLLRHALAGCAARGIEVLPIDAALDRCGVPPFPEPPPGEAP